MSTPLYCILISALLMCKAPTIFAQTEASVTEKAAAFSTALTTAQYEQAATFFDASLASQIDTEKLEEIWTQVTKQLKGFESLGAITPRVEDNTSVTYQPVQFKSTLLDLKLAFNEELKLIGMLFVPHQVFDLDLVGNDQFYEEAITVGKGSDFELPGILTLPKNKKNVPAIVLVHGSGPNDMDETYGPNKLFRDLAHQLAANGIAVLRYDKRTKTYGGSNKLNMNEFTLFEETIEDAIKATDLAAKHKKIDKKNVFVLGHSLGGMSAPRIGTLSDRAKGIIILAGNARPLQDLVLEQFEYLFGLDGTVTPEEQMQIDSYKNQLENLPKISNGESVKPENLPLNLPQPYWQYLLDYDQVETAQNLKKPILVIQGKRDYQVPMADYNIWQKALGKSEQVRFKLYDKLNHQMREGTGPSTPQEYEIKQRLPAYLTDDISAWVKDISQ